MFSTEGALADWVGWMVIQWEEVPKNSKEEENYKQKWLPFGKERVGKVLV